MNDESIRQELDDLNEPMPGVIGLPQYGRPWVESPDDAPLGWVKSLNEDPRYRSIAGMGTWLGIEAQEELMAAGLAQSGALQDAAHRIAQLAFGLDLAGRLWARRLPDDPVQRLDVFGPALGRLIADDGDTVLNHVTRSDAVTQSVFDAALFSSAAARLLRNGTSRTRHLANPNTLRRDELLRAAAKAPVLPARQPSGLPHVNDVFSAPDPRPLPAKVNRIIGHFIGHPLDAALAKRIGDELEAPPEPIGPPFITCIRRKLQRLVSQNVRVTRGLLVAIITGCMTPVAGDQDDPSVRESMPGSPPDRFTPVDPDGLGNGVSKALDPRSPDAPGRTRVQDGIKNLPIGNLAPPELPLGLDFPTWQLVNKFARDWLLPGVGTVASDSILSLQTNPVFIDAFLTGINAQFLAEARWRSLRVQRQFTPLRMFWGAINPVSGEREPDIKPLAEWAKDPTRPLGDKSHQVIDPHDANGKNDLVLLFRSELFRRYPGTQVYLIDKPATDVTLRQKADFTKPGVHGPIFIGTLTPDVTFFIFNVDPNDLMNLWLMIDEPPAELRFVSLPNQFVGAGIAVNTTCLDRPTRVAVDGAYLNRKGLI